MSLLYSKSLNTTKESNQSIIVTHMGCNVAQSNIFTLNAIRTEYDFYSSNIFTLNAIRTGVRTGRRPKVLA